MKKITSLAPARICLFGDHQDYLELPVIACAINRYIKLIAVPNNSEKFVILKPDIGETQIITIYKQHDKVIKGDYLSSALKVLRRYGCIPTKGFDVTITGNIAINAGTSSSTALIISWVKFLLETFGCQQDVTQELVAKIAHEAEVLEHASSGGRMDQYSIALGNIIYLETDANTYYETIGKELPGLIIAESGVPKPTLAVLKELRDKALESIEIIAAKFPKFNLQTAKETDVSKYVDYLPKELQPYFSAAILNHIITQKALKEFKSNDVNTAVIGALMTKHHIVLKEQLQLTVPKIDVMIDAALGAGAYGAKIVGSGRGGCIAAIASKENETVVMSSLKHAGSVNVYKVSVDSGARIIS